MGLVGGVDLAIAADEQIAESVSVVRIATEQDGRVFWNRSLPCWHGGRDCEPTSVEDGRRASSALALIVCVVGSTIGVV
jgi:hypothetical protein